MNEAGARFSGLGQSMKDLSSSGFEYYSVSEELAKQLKQRSDVIKSFF